MLVGAAWIVMAPGIVWGWALVVTHAPIAVEGIVISMIAVAEAFNMGAVVALWRDLGA